MWRLIFESNITVLHVVRLLLLLLLLLLDVSLLPDQPNIHRAKTDAILGLLQETMPQDKV
jgi:hypothetical protein